MLIVNICVIFNCNIGLKLFLSFWVLIFSVLVLILYRFFLREFWIDDWFWCLLDEDDEEEVFFRMGFCWMILNL